MATGGVWQVDPRAAVQKDWNVYPSPHMVVDQWQANRRKRNHESPAGTGDVYSRKLLVPH